ncbi:MAG: hypothetical protein JOY93_01765, partial [Acidobacteriales bacterium]|nr:hypothetical protein [Terriglobales bacterium]
MVKETNPVSTEHDWVLASLEHDQLSQAKKQHIPRRRLTGAALFIVWALRAYLVFMIVVVIYQIAT